MHVEVTSNETDVRALDARTLCAAFQQTVAAYPDRVALRSAGGEETTWGAYGAQVAALAPGLAALGLSSQQSMALLLSNRPEFHFADSAAMHLGAVPFSLYGTLPPGEAARQITDSDAHILVTERAFAGQLPAIQEAAPGLTTVVVVDGAVGDQLSLDAVAARGTPGFDFEAAWRAVSGEDLLTLIYTSGTTGPPKAVELTHRAIMTGIRSFHAAVPLPPAAELISYMPTAHIAERMCVHYLAMVHGFVTTCCPNPREVFGSVVARHPDWWWAPPRLWQKLKAAIEGGLAAEPDAEKRERTRWAIDVGITCFRAGQEGRALTAAEQADSERSHEILAPMLELLGMDRMQVAIVGAAPCQPELIEFWHGLGVPLVEGWGATEFSGIGTFNSPGEVRIGTVGKPMAGVELQLAPDGEILLRSDMLMRGYRNDAVRTREVIGADGWLRTGDVGKIDDDGFLWIVDRKKEIIVNAAGKNMSPANIESELRAAGSIVGQACVIGDDRPYNVALLVLDPDSVPAVRSGDGPAAEDAGVLQAVEEAVAIANERMSRVEQIKRFRVLEDEWQPGGDELTPTMKLKRKPIAAKYAAAIDELYG